jgi:GTP cyclohydrolase II
MRCRNRYRTYDANLALAHDDDERSYAAAAQMLHARRVRVTLLSNPDRTGSCGLA